MTLKLLLHNFVWLVWLSFETKVTSPVRKRINWRKAWKWPPPEVAVIRYFVIHLFIYKLKAPCTELNISIYCLVDKYQL